MRYTGPYAAGAMPTVAELFALSTPDRQVLLTPLLPDVQVACTAFLHAIPNVHSLTRMRVAAAAADALIDGYESRTVAIKTRLAEMRGSLPLTHADLCPYCSLDSNPDLDHFLPKKLFPEFSLYPYNFVPICTPCNRKKSNLAGNSAGERQFIFATYDACANACVLEAELNFRGDLHVRYYLDDGGVLRPDELALIERHFTKLDLATRYRKRAHGYLSAVKQNLKNGSYRSRRQFLRSAARNAAISGPTNGWEPALYRALSTRLDEAIDWLAV